MTDASRRPPAVLLGAGASVPAGLPAARDLTRRATDAANKDPHGRVLHFVVNALRLHDVRTGNQDYLEPEPGIERLVSAIELLALRVDLEVTPFVRDWDPMVDELERTTSEVFATSSRAEAFTTKMIKALTEAVSDGHGMSRPTRRSKSSVSQQMEVAQELISLIRDVTAVGRTNVFSQLHSKLVSQVTLDLKLGLESPTSYLNPILSLGLS